MSTARDRQASVDVDRRARRVARTQFDRPVVLEAGAGTGKTTALVARVVAWLLDAGFERAEAEVARFEDAGSQAAGRAAARALDGVLAITFTEAAAADMDAKIRAALALVEQGGTPLGMEDHAFRAASDLRIARARALRLALERPVAQTIHAWCQSLLLSHPLEAGLHPAFQVDPQGRAVEEIVRAVVTEELGRRLGAQPDPDWLALAERNVGPGTVTRAVTDLLVAGQRASDLAEDPFPPAVIERIERETWSAVRAFVAELRGPLETACRRTKKCGEVLATLDDILDRVREPARDPVGLSQRAREVSDRLDESIHDRLESWMRENFGKWMQEDVEEHLPAIARGASTIAPLLRRYTSLDPELEGAARRILARLLLESRARLVVAGIATFGDLLRDTRDLLERDLELRARLRAGLDQVLVDEFQDTDPVQCDLVRWIALDPAAGQKPGLLIVGDPKQSIYGWRRADLTAYERFVEEVRASGGIVEHLTVNFRSRQEILDHVEEVMQTAMTPEPGFQPPFQPLVAHRTETGGRLEHWNACT